MFMTARGSPVILNAAGKGLTATDALPLIIAEQPVAVIVATTV